MKLTTVKATNFRLLREIEISLNQECTVIVGRNNSGKTSLTELFKRLVADEAPKFQLEDFSLLAHEAFMETWKSWAAGSSEETVRKLLPYIEINFFVDYEGEADYGPLSPFIIDLNVDCHMAHVRVRYELDNGKIEPFFKGLEAMKGETEAEHRSRFFQEIRGRLPRLFVAKVFAIDPNEPSNQKNLSIADLREMMCCGFINAQRGLDDTTHKDRGILGKIIQRLFSTASLETADGADQQVAADLKNAVSGVQQGINESVNDQLKIILPALKLFGYPGLRDPDIKTETLLDVQRLLADHTKVRYAGINNITLPETYNGLGSRNLIFILLQLLEFFKSYSAMAIKPAVHLVFIEEPEAHLHPQMQEVFIGKLSQISGIFAEKYGTSWPVQFIVTTHSSHMANRASFDCIRYFLPVHDQENNTTTKIKDLSTGLSSLSEDDKDFLHKYMTLTRCDLLFADKIVLIEGASERIVLPAIIKKIDDENVVPSLASQYLGILEVGGAYAHKFFPLLDFLELPALVITDIDATKDSKVSPVSTADKISNACIKEWFSKPDISPQDLISQKDAQKIKTNRRIAYQIPESGSTYCGRSFEESFIFANPGYFGAAPAKLEEFAWKQADDLRLIKTDFALELAVDPQNEWQVPRYISEGLKWLAAVGQPKEKVATKKKAR